MNYKQQIREHGIKAHRKRFLRILKHQGQSHKHRKVGEREVGRPYEEPFVKTHEITRPVFKQKKPTLREVLTGIFSRRTGKGE